MFFVSEEFLRKYQEGEGFDRTIDEAVPIGQELVGGAGGKREFNLKQKNESSPWQSEMP